ncbi:hypothetical protein C8F01DRAFT_1161413 [Mycena amicta]|nr:hypothetical protein C8F01DRAFT_1161413 [Mycena amicta]
MDELRRVERAKDAALQVSQGTVDVLRAEISRLEFVNRETTRTVQEIQGWLHEKNEKLVHLRTRTSTLESDNRLQAAALEELRRPPSMHPESSSVKSSRFRILNADFETSHLVRLVLHEGSGRQVRIALSLCCLCRLQIQNAQLSQESWARGSKTQTQASLGFRTPTGKETVLSLQNYYLRWLVHDEPQFDSSELPAPNATATFQWQLPVRLVPQQSWVDPLPERPDVGNKKRPQHVPDANTHIPSPPRLSRLQLDEILWRPSTRRDKLVCNECDITGFLYALPLDAPLDALAAHSESYHRESCDVVVAQTAEMGVEEIRAFFLGGAGDYP